jgi:hypothetical protein
VPETDRGKREKIVVHILAYKRERGKRPVHLRFTSLWHDWEVSLEEN